MTITSPIEAFVLEEVIDILSKHFEQKVQIQSIMQLSEETSRNTILRIYLQNDEKELPKSLILKQSCSGLTETDEKAFSRFARDWAGLEFLSKVKYDDLLVPRFYGGSIEHRFVLLEDLGEQHVSLVNSLTGDDETQAIASLQRFMKSFGQLHGVGYGKTDTYFKILKKITPKVPSWQEDLKVIFDGSLPKVKSILTTFDIPQSESLLTEIDMAFKAPLEPGPFTAFIHGDNCPDNVFDDPDKKELHLIDFEWGFVRSALLDGTYLRMSMPTCWCVKTIPENLIDPLEAIYREELAKKIPAAFDDEAYHTAYTNACAFWMLKTFVEIEEVIDRDRLYFSGSVPENNFWNPDENTGRSRVLSRLQAFINVAERYNKLLHLRFMAEKVLRELKIRWPDAKPLDFYPAFKVVLKE